jgi:hypothetical protein
VSRGNNQEGNSAMGARIILVHEDEVFLESMASAMRFAGHTVITFDHLRLMVEGPRAPNQIEIAALQTKGAHAGIQFTVTSLPTGRSYAGMFSNFVAEPVSVAEAVNMLRCFLPIQPP